MIPCVPLPELLTDWGERSCWTGERRCVHCTCDATEGADFHFTEKKYEHGNATEQRGRGAMGKIEKMLQSRFLGEGEAVRAGFFR